MTLRSEALSAEPLESPSIDLGCGDGVFSFLHGSGVLDPSFDVFTATAHLADVRDEHADMFDCAGDQYNPGILVPPAATFDVGLDLKPALLGKAKRLGGYGRLIEHDCNQPLPLEGGSFQTAYCNGGYWITRIDLFLSELRRITRPGGRVILQVKLDSMRRYTLEAFRPALGGRVLDLLDRGRADCWPTLTDRATWEQRFRAAGLKVDDATPFVTRTHAHIWDVGLRPIAPMLVRMANALTPATRDSIKREWVDLFCELLEPLTNPTFDLFTASDEPAEIQYTLTPER
jgi:SAM-dependent methyltransferase